MTTIQENNYIHINTKKLFEDFNLCLKNLSIGFEGLRLNNDYIYDSMDSVLNDINIIDIAVDKCDTLYIAGQDSTGQEQNLYLYNVSEKILKKIRLSAAVFPIKLNAISAIGVDKDTLYIADYISQSSANKTDRVKARLIALTKRDFQIRWILSTGSDGTPLNRIRTIECDYKGKIYVIEEKTTQIKTNRVLYLSTADICYPAFRVFYSTDEGDFTSLDFTVDADGFFYLLLEKHIDDNKGANSGNGRKEYILKIWQAKKEGAISTVEHKIPINDFLSSGIEVAASNQIFIWEYKPDTGLTIHKLSNDAVDARISLTIHKPSNKTPDLEEACLKLIGDSKGNFYVINGKNKLIHLARKKLNDKGHLEGTYISKPIDSHAEKTRWHRLLLEGEFKSGTQVDFEYYVSDKKLSDEEIRGPSFEEWNNCVSKASAIKDDTKRDALFLKNIEGRYLWFKLTLSGSEVLSPVIKSITVFFPRVSYLDYLPAIYQENSISKVLLERFLAIFESIFYEIDFEIDHIGRFFDACGAPPEFLSWLGSWLAVSMDEDWPEDKKRLFIRNAVSLYKKKGTREGLEESIELFTGRKPFIVERFQALKSCTGNISQAYNKEKLISLPSQEKTYFPLKDLTVKKCPENKDKEEYLIDTLYGTERFSFCVLLSDPDLDTTAQGRIRKIIEEQKPAHTSYELKLLEPFFYLDRHTYLEINTVVTEPKFILEKTSMLGRDTILHDEENAGQIERHSRAGIDTLLL